MSSHPSVQTFHPSELSLFHLNPRSGDTALIAGSLRANGQYRPVVVNKGTHTGRPMEVLAGNHTLMAIRDLAEKYPDDDRWQSVLAVVHDVDDDRAARIVAADNRTATVGGFDDRILAELLGGLDDLDGTGYDMDDLADIEALLEERDTPAASGESGSKGEAFGEDGMGNNTSLEDLADGYGQSGTRIVMLSYDINQFTWLQEQMEVIAEARGLDSNAAVLVDLVFEATGVEPPAAAPAPAETDSDGDDDE